MKVTAFNYLGTPAITVEDAEGYSSVPIATGHTVVSALQAAAAEADALATRYITLATLVGRRAARLRAAAQYAATRAE